MTLIVLFFMVLMHIIEDFHLQGVMAKMKQKGWWYGALWDDVYTHIPPNEKWDDETVQKKVDALYPKYDADYISVLALHGFEWAMFVHIPVMVFYWLTEGFTLQSDYITLVCCSVFLQTIIHAYIDDLKANKYSINLIQDQCIHMVQIIVIYIMFMVAV